ncbi:hypothetical protein EJ04DRAFT_574978 [Polyplosphaeria fusca]|uniref:Ras modification protein ERF4 n=1 Tax=Polyplosphaeria fusca TaxID=682080 RepID=A0A9P4R505_9PLEO|nr:hypothetical protein EJ04DRAFT_574978 [Polyplosphaeria fusca]
MSNKSAAHSNEHQADYPLAGPVVVRARGPDAASAKRIGRRFPAAPASAPSSPRLAALAAQQQLRRSSPTAAALRPPHVAKTASQAAPASPPSSPRPSASTLSALPAPPLPARWSLTNRIFNLNLRSVYSTNTTTSAARPRQPASRLWNPVNSSPRTLVLPNVPVQAVLHHQHGANTRDEYPLLTLPEQRRSRQSPVPSSLVVERSTGGDSGRTSIGLPRDRRSAAQDSQPPTPRFDIEFNMPDQIRPSRDDAHAASPTAEDPEQGTKTAQRRSSRISIPHSRPGSMHSRLGTASAIGEGEGEGEGDDESEFAWGPSHPCFPHPNPHVPLGSPLYAHTKIIRIKRDWMIKGDLAPTFANLYPEILDPLISEDDFRNLIKHINDTLIKAFDPTSFRAWADAILGVLTFWIWEDLGLTHVKKQLADLEKWIDAWNAKVGEKEGVRIISLRRTGYLTLDIMIPDPQIGIESSSRPDTQNDTQSAAPVQHGEHGPLTVNVQASSPPLIETQS